MDTIQNQETVTSVWNSLEIVKLTVGILTPIIIAIIAYRFNRMLKKIEKQQWTNQKIIEKRIEIFDLIVPKLNDLFCFYCYIGNWKDFSPSDIIKSKRQLDKEVNIYCSLFSDGLAAKYNDLSELLFDTFAGWGQDAKIKSLCENRKLYGKSWEEGWEKHFNTKKVSDVKLVKEKYYEIIDFLKKDLEIHQSSVIAKSMIPNINFK